MFQSSIVRKVRNGNLTSLFSITCYILFLKFYSIFGLLGNGCCYHLHRTSSIGLAYLYLVGSFRESLEHSLCVWIGTASTSCSCRHWTSTLKELEVIAFVSLTSCGFYCNLTIRTTEALEVQFAFFSH